MAQNAGTINVTLSANTVAFNTGMSKAAQAAKDAGREIRGAFDKLGDVASVALAPFGELGVVMGNAFKGLGDLAPGILKSFGGISEAAAGFISVSAGIAGAAAAIGAAMGEMAVQGADAIERLLIVSQKTGLAIRDLQVFEAAGMTVDVSLEDMVTGMRKFDQALTGTSKQAAIAKAVLGELGVTSSQPKEALLQVADAFSKMPDGATKGAEAVALFGRSGLALIPLLNKGREGIEEWEASVEKFGHHITGEEIGALEAWKKSTTDLSVAWTGLKESLSGTVLPTLSKVVETIAWGVRATQDWSKALGILSVAGILIGGMFGQKKQAAAEGPKGRPNFFPIEGIELFKRQWKELDETMADGGRASHALAVLKLKIQGEEIAGNYLIASQLRERLPILEAEVAAEKEAAKEAERRALAHAHLVAAMVRQSEGLAHGSHGELGPQFPAGFFEARTAAAAVAAPDVQIGDDQLASIGSSIKHVIAGNVQEGTEIGQEALAAFYKHWDEENKKSTAVINESYQKQLTEFQGFLALGEISQKQFADVSVALEQERVLKILKAREAEIRTWDEEALKFGSFQDKFHALLNEVALDGENFGQKVFESFHKAIDGISDQLAHFVVTGKANFKQLLTSMEESIAKAGFQQLFGKASSFLADKLGLPNILGAGKPDGTIGNPLHVMIVAGPGGLFGGAGGGGLGGLFGGGQNSESGGGGGLFGGLFGGGSSGGGGGGIFGFLSNLFGGGGGGGASGFAGFGDLAMDVPMLASGGDVTPGKAYVVGEKHPEFFVPRQPGHVSPSLQTGTHIINMGGIHIHGVQDADSFNKSKAQIYAELRSEMDRGLYRNNR